MVVLAWTLGLSIHRRGTGQRKGRGDHISHYHTATMGEHDFPDVSVRWENEKSWKSTIKTSQEGREYENNENKTFAKHPCEVCGHLRSNKARPITRTYAMSWDSRLISCGLRKEIFGPHAEAARTKLLLLFAFVRPPAPSARPLIHLVSSSHGL